MNIYLIKDLARISGYSIYTLKYYLKIGLLKEAGRFPETNFRYFNDLSIERLKTIHELRKQRKSIKQIRQILESKR